MGEEVANKERKSKVIIIALAIAFVLMGGLYVKTSILDKKTEFYAEEYEHLLSIASKIQQFRMIVQVAQDSLKVVDSKVAGRNLNDIDPTLLLKRYFFLLEWSNAMVEHNFFACKEQGYNLRHKEINYRFNDESKLPEGKEVVLPIKFEELRFRVGGPVEQ